MQIQIGTNPNCSETVYRISKGSFKKIPRGLIRQAWGSLKPRPGYSQMRPYKYEVCIYFYQTFGAVVMNWLEENKIPYDTQMFEASKEDFPGKWKSLKKRNAEKKLPREGGGGDFFRRRKYGRRKRRKS